MTRMSAKQYLQINRTPKPKRSKYRAVAAYRCRACGLPHDAKADAIDIAANECAFCDSQGLLRFASGAEAKRYDALKQEERLGLISNLRLQVRYPLHCNGTLVCTYVADFVFERDGEIVILDCKGAITPAYRIKRKLMAANGFVITEVAA